MKRLISFILSACMLFTCMVVPVSADYISPDPVLPDDDSFWIYTDNEPEVILPDSSSTCTNGNHGKTQDVQVATEYKTKNSSKHYEIAHYETKCKNCGEVLDTYTKKIAEVKHYYEAGSTTCWYCEYNKKCTHEKTYTKYGEDTYKQYNSKYHKCITEIDIICEYCGKTVDTDKETTKEKHYYSGLVCKYCDYEKECDHEETRTKSYAVEYTDVNEKNHYVWYNTKVKICQECGEEVSRTGKKQLQAHYYENRVCTGCGYEKTEKENVKEETVKTEETQKEQETTVAKKEPQYIEEMKSGKLYAVGNDGCLYKRTYDANQAIGYIDTYAYTPTTIYDDFTLTKGEILIEKGNYLYDTNGNKVSATVSTMKTCDIRINQLKSVIEQGAENAYSVGTITASRKNSIVSSVNTKVAAYKAVKQGKKTLNQISEYKASYKSKTGNENSTVKKIQEKLYEIGFTSQLVTGYYGDITLNNVAYFQIVNSLDVTGWVDSKTYNKLFAKTTAVEVIEKPFAAISYVASDEEGNLNICAEGNESCDVIRVIIRQGNNFREVLTVEDNDADVICELPKSGAYDVYVTGETTSGDIYKSETISVTISKKTIVDKITDIPKALGAACWGVIEAFLNDATLGVYSGTIEVYISADRNEVYLVARSITDGILTVVSAKTSAALIAGGSAGGMISAPVTAINPPAGAVTLTGSAALLAGATYMGAVSVTSLSDMNDCKNKLLQLMESDKNGGGYGERSLRDMYGGESQKHFKTPTNGGSRYIDQYADEIAHESKVGYTTLNKRVKRQVLKDAELLDAGTIQEAHWHFFKSKITGKIGASKELLEFLEANGITYTIHK